MHIPGNSSTPTDQTHGYTILAILSLHDVLLNQSHAKNSWTSCNTTLQVHGELWRSYPVLPIVWSTKKHAAVLSPYPPELIPFTTVDSADTCYRQLYKPISAYLFKEASNKGLTPL